MTKHLGSEWENLVEAVDHAKELAEKQGANSFMARYSTILELLLSKDREAKKIRGWFIKNALGDEGWKDIYSPHEFGVWELARLLAKHKDVDEWGMMSKTDRAEYLGKVGVMARELAKLLKDKDLISYPDVLSLFDDDKALDLVGLLSAEKRDWVLTGTGYLLQEGQYIRTGQGYRYRQKPIELKYGEVVCDEPLTRDDGEVFYRVWKPVGERFVEGALTDLEPQTVPSILERLADYVAYKINENKGVLRASGERTGARLLALELDKWFFESYQKYPNEIIASCVTLRYPDLENPVTGETVRKWCYDK